MKKKKHRLTFVSDKKIKKAIKLLSEAEQTDFIAKISKGEMKTYRQLMDTIKETLEEYTNLNT